MGIKASSPHTQDSNPRSRNSFPPEQRERLKGLETNYDNLKETHNNDVTRLTNTCSDHETRIRNIERRIIFLTAFLVVCFCFSPYPSKMITFFVGLFK